jgi:cell wall-associated NlpC family hydrolase
MHHPRLVGGLAALAVLLILIMTQVASAAPTRPQALSLGDRADLPGVVRNARTGVQAARLVKRQLGAPYVFGGASPTGFDASGLTMYVFAQLGVALPHGATDQLKASKPIPLGRLCRGDLVFWGSKKYSYDVAIYMGRGRVISAPHAGAVVGYGTIKGAWTGGRLLPVR